MEALTSTTNKGNIQKAITKITARLQGTYVNVKPIEELLEEIMNEPH